MATTTRKQSEIQSPAIYRIEDKITHKCLGYLVQSDREVTQGVHEFYQVTWENDLMGWRCTCPSRVSCKHVRAVREVVMFRYQREHDQKRTRSNNFELSMGIS